MYLYVLLDLFLGLEGHQVADWIRSNFFISECSGQFDLDAVTNLLFPGIMLVEVDQDIL
jgi:hypothetical protein